MPSLPPSTRSPRVQDRRRFLLGQSLSPRGRSPRLNLLDHEEEIERAWRAGERPESIAVETGTQVSQVRRLAKVRGWPRQEVRSGAPAAPRSGLLDRRALAAHAEEIGRLWAAAVPAGDIAARFSTRPPAVHALARLRGWPRRVLDEALAERLWKDGVAVADIAYRCCVSHGEVRALAEARCWPRRVKQRAIDDEAALLMWKQGMLMTQIAAAFGVTPSAISRLAVKNGWKKRRKGLSQPRGPRPTASPTPAT